MINELHKVIQWSILQLCIERSFSQNIFYYFTTFRNIYTYFLKLRAIKQSYSVIEYTHFSLWNERFEQ